MAGIMLGMMVFFSRAEAMDLQIHDGDVRTVLQAAAKMGQLNLVVADDVTGKITLNLQDVSGAQAIKLICEAQGLYCEERQGTFVVLKSRENWQGMARTYVFPVKYGDLEVMRDAINLSLGEAGFLSETSNKDTGTRSDETTRTPLEKTEKMQGPGRLLIDRTANELIFYGTEEEARQARSLLEKIDVPAQQVALTAKVVAVRKQDSSSLGIVWSDGGSILEGEDASIIHYGYDRNGAEYRIQARLNALVSEGKAEILARPEITTVQGQEALINIGGEVPVPKSSTTNTSTTNSIEYKEAGIILRCTPRVNTDGYVTVDVHTEVSSPLYVREMKAYRFQKRSADTVVRLLSGETMVIGGLIGREETEEYSKVPLLGDLPLLGSLFRNKNLRTEETEVMIFVTARIL